MEVVENITRTTLQEIEKVLNTRTIVGEPIIIEGKTIIPLISIAFGFGAGGGSGKGEGSRKGEGEGGGTGGGAIIRPVAVIISDKDGMRVEPVVGGIAGAMEKIGESVPKLIEKVVEQLAKRREGN
jgi:uncharacterized spore protein YtfJ